MSGARERSKRRATRPLTVTPLSPSGCIFNGTRTRITAARGRYPNQLDYEDESPLMEGAYAALGVRYLSAAHSDRSILTLTLIPLQNTGFSQALWYHYYFATGCSFANLSAGLTPTFWIVSRLDALPIELQEINPKLGHFK